MTDRQQETRDAVWALIPWYVNGTLDEDERARVEHHAAKYPACQREIAEQRRLADAMSETDIAEHVAEAAWRNIHNRIAPKRRLAWVAVPPLPLGLAAATCIMALVVVSTPQFGPPDNADFSTLTVEPKVSEILLKIRPVPGADPADVQAVLNGAGILAAGQPSETGLITMPVPPNLDAAALAEELMQSPLIAFVAGDF